MKSLIDLWHQMAHDAAIRCHASTVRDCKTVTERVKHEGVSFLTISLPELAAGLQKGLERGSVSPDDFPGFRCRRRTPLFLGALFDYVFDGDSGQLLDDPDVDAIQMIRQLSLAFQKVELPCSETREAKAFRDYIKCEQEVRDNDRKIGEIDLRRFSRMASILFGNVFSIMDTEIDNFDLLPKHGPGATADRKMGNSKYDQQEWPERLEAVFPYLDYCLPNARYNSYLDRVAFLEPGAERPVRVIQVPKTLKTPRIIAIEPVAMQYTQQSLAERFHALLPQETYGMIGFHDQEVNNRLAHQGSIDKSLSTIDLSEASDRVSNQLVRAMFRPWRSLFEAVDATRSRKADVPGHGVIRLAKYASMGSALCFPVEAMVFLTCAFLGIEKSLARPLKAYEVIQYAGRVRVFGDDIIVPDTVAYHVIAELEHFGAVVNRRKTFLEGYFRESCGKEYYRGADVSMTKVRRLLPTSRGDVSEVVSLVATRNLFYKQGLWQTTKWLDGYLGGILDHFPTVHNTSSLLGRHTFLDFPKHEEVYFAYGSDFRGVAKRHRTFRYHPDLQYPEVKGYRVVTRLPVNPLDDVYALQKFFLKREIPLEADLPSVDKKHLERSGRPQAVDIKLGWGSIR